MRRDRRTGRRSETVNRGWLKRQILKGNVEAKRDYRHTDDYRYDAATDFGITDWMPATVLTQEERVKGCYREGNMKFDEGDFRGYGHAWWNEDGTISLSYGWESYTLRLTK